MPIPPHFSRTTQCSTPWTTICTAVGLASHTGSFVLLALTQFEARFERNPAVWVRELARRNSDALRANRILRPRFGSRVATDPKRQSVGPPPRRSAQIGVEKPHLDPAISNARDGGGTPPSPRPPSPSLSAHARNSTLPFETKEAQQ